MTTAETHTAPARPMLKDPELGKELLQPLKLQGVTEIADSALVVRLKFTVRPLKPTWVQRECLKRLYKLFGEKGIQFASNAVMVQTTGTAAIPLDVATGAAASAQSVQQSGAAVAGPAA